MDSNSIVNNNSELSGTIRWTTSSGLSAHNNSDLVGTIRWTTSPYDFAHFKVSANFRALMDIPSNLGCNHLFTTFFDQVEANTKSNNISKLTGTIEWIPSSGLFAHNSSDLGFGFNHHFVKAKNISDFVGSIGWTSSSGFATHKIINLAGSIR